MVTVESALKKMHEYETKVLTALGFKIGEPVGLIGVEPAEETVTFYWAGPGDPPPPRGGFHTCDYASNMYPRYTVHASALSAGVWEAIMEARADWESNFRQARP